MLSIGASLAPSKFGVTLTSSLPASSRASVARKPLSFSRSSLKSKFAGKLSVSASHWSQTTVSSLPTSIASSSVRCYARRPKVAAAAAPMPTSVKKKAITRKLTQKERDEDEDILDDELLNEPDVSQPYTDEQVPEDLKRPMKDVKLPNQKFVFNHKTYRYKDLQANDPDRITSEWTAPAGIGSQMRPGESLEAVRHTKDNPSEDLSKDALASSSEGTPVGLDKPVVPYVSQITQAVYDILMDEKGEDITVIDISGKTNWVPTMIIVTAMSSRHVVAIANRVSSELKRTKLVRNPRIERNVGDEWAIVATGTTIVEIFTPEQREYMDLERLWVLKKSAQETFEFDEEEERFMYDAEDGMWDDDDPDF